MNSEIKFNVDSCLVAKLIASQFLEFAHLPIREVKEQGHDNYTFRLGEDMLVRLPSMECYALAVAKEQKFLPLLAPYLNLKISTLVKAGEPSSDYPFHFSIYRWLCGDNATVIDEKGMEEMALGLARFLRELWNIPNLGGPLPGIHNWYRGDHIKRYEKEAQAQITSLNGIIDTDRAANLWQEALKIKWQKPGVWIHGDFSSNNILVERGVLSAVIDFGCIGIGDPACDLVIAWTFLKGKAREIFKKVTDVDDATWLRAKAWALWKATFELCQIEDKNSGGANKHKQIIESVLN